MEDKTSTTQISHRTSLQPPSQQSDQPSSPLERLDPQRLREQAVASHLGSHPLQGGNWSPASITMNVNSPIRTPGSVQSPMANSVQQGHHSSGNADSMQHYSNQHQYYPGNDPNYMHQQQDKGSRTPNIQNPSPSRQINPAHLASPQSLPPQSPYVPRTPNPSNPNIQYIQQQGQQYHTMVVNNQQMYAATPQTPGTSNSNNTQRIAYQIQPSNNQFTYANPQQVPQQSGQQQCITVQGYQMPPQQNTRVAVQPMNRVVHRLPPGYNQTNMVYTNVSAAPATNRTRPVYAHVITTQTPTQSGPIQQVIQQSSSQASRAPQAAHINTPTTPGPSSQMPTQGNFYTVQTYQQNYQGNAQSPVFVQQKQQNIRPFTGNTTAVQQIPDSSHYQVIQPTPNVQPVPRQVQPGQLQQPQTMTVGQFVPHQRNNQVNLMSPSINQPMTQQHIVRQQLPIRAVAPGAPQIRPHFSFDNSFHVPQDICLSGCYFLLAENNTGIDVRSIFATVKYYGGEIELFNNRMLNERITHVIGEYITSPPIHVFIDRKDNPRKVCTLQWLNDIIDRRRVEPPFKVCHLPGALNRTMSLADKIISVTGFNEKEITNLKWMIQLIGAKFSPYLSKNTNFLVAKSMTNAKVDKIPQVCQTHNISIVNVNWLCELYMGSTTPLSNIRDARYSPSTPAPLEIGAQNIFALNEHCARMMNAWQYQFAITEEHLRRGSENKRLILADDSICISNKYSKLFENGPIPTEEQIDSAIQYLEKENVCCDIKITFSGFNKRDVELLSRKIKILGVKIVEKTEDANFVVAPQNFSRTTNILKAIASGKDIISPLWIINCFAQLQIVPTEDYFLQDTKSEQTLIYNLKTSVLSNRRQPIFKNTWFYVSPSVKPSRSELVEIIQCAGGNIEKTRPTRETILKFIEEDRPYIIIASPCDLIFFQKLTECGVPMFSEEFVYCTIMRYKVETSNVFAINLNPPQRGQGIRSSMTSLTRPPLISAQTR